MIIQKLELKIQQCFSIQKSTLQIRYFSTHKQNNLKSKLEKIMILKTISLSKLCRDETGIMAYQVKLMTLVCQIDSGSVPATALPTQIHINAPRKAAENLSALAPVSTWENQLKLLNSGFCLAHPQALQVFGEWTIEWKISQSLPDFHATFQANIC